MTGTLPDALQASVDAAAADAARNGSLILDGGGDTLSLAALRELLFRTVPGLGAGVTRLVLRRFRAEEDFRLAGIRTPLHLHLIDGAWERVDVSDAELGSFAIVGGSLRALLANRLTSAGSLFLCGARTDAPQAARRSLHVREGVFLSGATIRGNLDMRGAKLRSGPSGAATQRGLGLCVHADGLAVGGNALLCDYLVACGEIRLNGARIARNLVIASAWLANPGGYSVSAAGARVEGTVYFDRYAAGRAATRSAGAIRLSGARIGGDLSMSGAQCTASIFAAGGGPSAPEPRDFFVLEAEGVDVAASVQLDDGFSATGALSLIVARIGNDLQLTRGAFRFPGESVFNADGAHVGGCTFLDGALTDGLIRLVLTRLEQGLNCEGLTLSAAGTFRGLISSDADMLERDFGRTNLCGVQVSNAEVGGAFTWRGVRRDGVDDGGRTVTLAAAGARVSEVDDDQASWRATTHIDLQDCLYARLTRIEKDDARDRIARLDAQYAAWNGDRWLPLRILRRTATGALRDETSDLAEQVRRFVPTPYLQLAAVYKNAGLDAEASRVLLRLERNRTNYAGRTVRGLLWRYALGISIKYGQSPFRPLAFVIPWVALSGWWFQWLEAHRHEPHLSGGGESPVFDGWMYALDTVLPIVDLGAKKRFVIDHLWSLAGGLLLFNSLLGYLAAALIAAGLSGLVRTGKPGG